MFIKVKIDLHVHLLSFCILCNISIDFFQYTVLKLGVYGHNGVFAFQKMKQSIYPVVLLKTTITVLW